MYTIVVKHTFARPWHYVALAAMALVVLPTLVQRTGRGDLQILELAALRLRVGEPVYRLSDGNEHTKPPLATLAFVPFSYIPQFWLCRLWDLINLCVFAALVKLIFARFSFGRSPPAGTMMVAAIFVVLTPFNAELRLGQYNLILLLGILFAEFRKAWLGLGVALAFGVLFKPTLLLLFPWAFATAEKRWKVVAGGALAVTVLSGIYCLWPGADRLIVDTLEWLDFLPQSSAKHLLRLDNHGLPSALAVFGWKAEKTIVLAGLVLACVVAWTVEDRLASLALGCALCVVSSPMAWVQNYTLLLPAVVWTLHRWLESPSRYRWAYLSAIGILWLGIGALNPTTSDWLDTGKWPVARIPLVALLASAAVIAATEIIRRWETSGRAVVERRRG